MKPIINNDHPLWPCQLSRQPRADLVTSAISRALRAIPAVVLLCVTGCGDFNQATDTQRQPANVPGIAPAGGLDELQKSPAKNSPAVASNSQSRKPNESKNTAPKRGIIGKTTAKIVDAKKAKQNPQIVEVENKLSGSDPISIAASAYISLSSRASLFGFQSSLKQYKIVNEKAPSYDEFLKMTEQHGIKFAMLPPYQMYGYDEKKGGIVILEDKAEKIRRYKAANIPLDDADKKFDDSAN